MAQKIIQDLNEDFLHCSICMERFKKPVMLPCLHSFCFHCLKKWESLNSRGKDFSCPVCRQHVDLPEEGVEGLPNNFFLSSLMERLELVEKLTKQTSSKCNFCRGDLGLLFCLDCQLHMCSTCKITHARIPGTGDHIIISAEKLSDEDYLKQIASTQTPRCDEHEEKLRFYCKTCFQLICRDCTVVTHQGHECTKAESEATLAKERLQELLEESKGDSKKGHKKSKKCEQAIKRLEAQADKLLEKVDLQYDKCVEKLKSDRESLRKKIENLKIRKCRPIEKKKAAVCDVLQVMTNPQDVTTRVLQGNNPWEILRMERDITRSFEKVNEYIESFDDDFECSGSSSDEYDCESSSSDNSESGNSDDDKNSDGNSSDVAKNSDGNSSDDDEDDSSDDDEDIGMKFKPSKIKPHDMSDGEAETSSTSNWRHKNLVGKIVRS